MITPADSAPQAPPQMPASSWDIQAPYSAGPEVHVHVHGDADPGGSDKTSQTAAGAVAASQARQRELESDTFGQGSVIGDIMTLPPNPLDPGAGPAGTTAPSGAYYDPPRNYGDEPA
jgi:hypothetical protein